jgi:hypothetical protein
LAIEAASSSSGRYPGSPRRARTRARITSNEAMTENIAYYTRHGYAETRRYEQDGFRRVFFRKPVP